MTQLRAGHLTLWIGPLRRITHVYHRNQTTASLSCEAIWSRRYGTYHDLQLNQRSSNRRDWCWDRSSIWARSHALGYVDRQRFWVWVSVLSDRDRYQDCGGIYSQT